MVPSLNYSDVLFGCVCNINGMEKRKKTASRENSCNILKSLLCFAKSTRTKKKQSSVFIPVTNSITVPVSMKLLLLVKTCELVQRTKALHTFKTRGN